MSKRSLFLLFLLGFIWGTNFLLMKLTVSLIPVLDVAMWRTGFGALPILFMALFRRDIALSDLKYFGHFTAMAMLANVAPYILFIIGTQYLPSGITGVMAGTVPCITAAIVSIAIPSERPTLTMVLGLLSGLIGIILLSPIGETHPHKMMEWVGIVSVLGGAVCYALALVYARRFIKPLGLSSVRLAAWQMLIALLMLLPFTEPSTIMVLAQHPAILWGMIIGLGILGTGIGFVIYYMLIADLGALRAGSVYYIPPAVALLMGYIFLNESFGGREAIGMIFILIGVYYANRKTKRS